MIDLDGEALAEQEDALRRLAEGRGSRVAARQCDISKREELREAYREITRELGPVEILVNNAGVLVPGGFLDQPMVKWEKTLTVNLNAVVELTHMALPSMYEANRGVVVNVSSAAGTLGVAGLTVYAASKWGIWGFTESLRHEAWNAGKGGVRFSSVHPSFIRHGLFEGAKLRRLGGILVPRIKDHDVVAKAIVEDAIRKKKTVVMRPRSVRLTPLLRGLLPDAAFQWLIRFLGVDHSMESWRGSTSG
jgi:all-trans-retinol dehydrogenase (NAD+)